ncbi:MAG: hypothetical protein IPJ65_42220 [Archangiaceae bacterium]|nr:hypothetical protein [Archangiaceae bacterium]
MAQRLYARYAFAARLSGGSVARVGEAWRFADEAALYADDGSHPGPEGTLLSACVLTPAVTGDAAKVPEVPPLGLSSERAGELCALATGIACPYSPTATVCGFACVETDTDAENCGGCRVRCAPAQQCSAGHCR